MAFNEHSDEVTEARVHGAIPTRAGQLNKVRGPEFKHLSEGSCLTVYTRRASEQSLIPYLWTAVLKLWP